MPLTNDALLGMVNPSPPTWAGHGGVRDGDDLRGGAGGGRAAAVGRVVNPALAQPQVALVLARVPAAGQLSSARSRPVSSPVVAAHPGVVLAAVDPPDHPPVPLHLLDAGDLLHRVLRAGQALPVRRHLGEAAMPAQEVSKVARWAGGREPTWPCSAAG